MVVGLFMIVLFNLFTFITPSQEEELVFSDFMNKLEASEIAEVVIKQSYISGLMKDGKKFKTYTTDYPDMVKILRERHVKIIARPPDENPW
ncbi:MAG TPA: ATP-dependent metallopeptidase FtsH/Yme1/Tma family protein, partial [Nitrospiria bacterium]|nr:ATP-dependent metallopeptidase FtsH/Yme1/Tma family protein [Nitrospiria bacterium]